MSKPSKLKEILILMLTFMELGLFSFGGGATMLTLIRTELVLRKRWLDDDELVEMTAIAESTPGPIAINLATYLGYKRAGFWGALFATLGVAIPTFTIMFLISLVYKGLPSAPVVEWIFTGIKCGVVFLILYTSVSLTKTIGKHPLTIIIFVTVFLLMVFFTIYNVNFSAFWFVIIGIFIGLISYVWEVSREKRKGKDKK